MSSLYNRPKVGPGPGPVPANRQAPPTGPYQKPDEAIHISSDSSAEDETMVQSSNGIKVFFFLVYT